jgi:Ni/Co efflux regulator RcnB
MKNSLLVTCAVAAAMLAAPAAMALSLSGVLNANKVPKLEKMSSQEEREYIEKNNLGNNYTVKVTTKNQDRFDRDGDGYLSGDELNDYLRKYER